MIKKWLKMIINVSICQFWDSFYTHGRLKYHPLMVLVVFYILICSFEFLRAIYLDWTILDLTIIDINFSINWLKNVLVFQFWHVLTTLAVLENEVQQYTGGLSSTLKWFTGALEGLSSTLKCFSDALRGSIVL